MQALVGRTFEVTLGGRVRHLRLGMNAICAAEQLTGMKLLFGLGVEPWASAQVLRALVWAGLQWSEEQLPPERRSTLEQVGDWIDEAGAGDVVAAIMAAWLEAMPEPEEEEVETTADPLPERPQHGATS